MGHIKKFQTVLLSLLALLHPTISLAQFLHLNPYEYSDEIHVMLTEACKNQREGLLQNCKVEAWQYFGPYIVTGLIQGHFTGHEYNEVLVEYGINEGESGPAYLLMQQQTTGWHFLNVDSITKPEDPFQGNHQTGNNNASPMIFQGINDVLVVTLDGSLEVDEMSAENFNIQVTHYSKSGPVINEILAMPRKSNYDDCGLRKLTEGEPFAKLEEFFQEDINQDGFKDLILHVNVRYWKSNAWYDDYPAGTTIKYSECLSNFFSHDRLVIFYFDGYKFNNGVNTEWLIRLFDVLD